MGPGALAKLARELRVLQDQAREAERVARTHSQFERVPEAARVYRSETFAALWQAMQSVAASLDADILE